MDIVFKDMKNKILQSFFMPVVMLLIAMSARAQVFPVDVNTNLTPPYSAFIADYSQVGSNRWMTNITLRDANEPSLQVRLRITIESSTIKLQTKPNFVPANPIVLSPNVPKQISGSDLQPYLSYNNLQFSGIPRTTIEQNGKIPEGMYTFKVEVLEYTSGKVISRPAQASAYIQLRDQPLTSSPACSTAVSPSQGQNTIFQWQPASSPGPGAGGTTEYQFTLFEITDNNIDPMNAITNNAIFKVYESQWQMQTTLVYGVAQPALDLGKKYVWQVQARDGRGFTSFKNNGVSSPCWFSYGYPTGGTVSLTKPDDEFSFTKEDQIIFEWGGISNDVPGQQTKYTLKIVELNNNQDPAQAIKNNPPYKSQTTTQLPATGGYQVMLDSLPKDAEFAWRVVAKSDGQKVAESAVRTFTSPPFLEKFLAGSHEVLVTTLENTDLTNIKGTGKLKIGGDDSTLLDVSFENLKLLETAGQIVLDEGEIESSVQMDTFGLESLTEGIPNGIFHPEAVKLNKNALSLKGKATYTLPLATTASGQAEIETETDWVNYDNYYLQGGLKLSENNSFSLMDPAGIKITYDETSEIIISENRFTGNYNGEITFEGNDIVDAEGQTVVIPFVDFDNLHYNTIEHNLSDVKIYLVENTKMHIDPTKITVDFSEDESPGSKSGDKDWTGLYFDEVDFVIPPGFDENAVAFIDKEVRLNAALSQSHMMKNSIDSKGLNFEIDYSFSDKLVSAHAFIGEFDYLKFDVDGGDVKSGEIAMDLTLPMISTDTKFDVLIPLTNSGMDEAYFDGNFTGLIEIDKDDQERYQTIEVSNAHFDSDGNLEMSAKYECPKINLTVDNISDFKMDAANRIGFGAVNAPHILETPVSSKLEGMPITVDAIGAIELKDYGTAVGARATVEFGTGYSHGSRDRARAGGGSSA